MQAVLDLVSRDRDPLLAFSDDQFLYPGYRRIPATRFQQRYFLVGSIYLGQTGPQYILHDTWKWFGRRPPPVEPGRVPEDGPHRLEAVRPATSPRTSRRVFDGNVGTVELRNDVADSVLHGPAPSAWRPPAAPAAGSGWTLDGSSAVYAPGTTPVNRDRLALATHACERIDGDFERRPGRITDGRVPRARSRPARSRSSRSRSTAATRASRTRPVVLARHDRDHARPRRATSATRAHRRSRS